jgi:hypothetical protein
MSLCQSKVAPLVPHFEVQLAFILLQNFPTYMLVENNNLHVH